MIGLLGFALLAMVGHLQRLGAQTRFALLAGWWAVLMLLHVPALQPLPLARTFGGDFAGWSLLGLLAALFLGYRTVLRRVQARVVPQVQEQVTEAFRPAELDRYARHILLREIGGPGQRRLKDAKVLVVGAGGLGSSALLYLAAAGVGTIGVIDDDVVEGSNLQRQVIHADQRIGMAKVQSAEIAMRALNPFIDVRPYQRKLSEDNAEALLADYDLVLDGTDNFDTRYLVNRVAARLGKPLVSAAMTQWEGQIAVYDPAKGGPCYACVFPERPAPGMVPACAEAGVVAPLPGVIGSMMALEAVKTLTGAGQTLRGRLLVYDALYADVRVIGAKRRADCDVCGQMHKAG